MVAYFVADISDMVVNLADKLAGQFGWNADPELQRVIEMSRREYELELERAETLEATRIQQGMQSGQEPVQSDTFTDEQMFQMVLEMSIVTEEAERLKRERDEMESKLKLKQPVTSYRVPVRTLQQEVDALKLEISQLEGRMDALQMRASKLAVQPDKEDEIDQVMVELSTLSYECENRVDELEQLERQLHRPSVSRSSSIMDAEVIPVRPPVRSDTELRIDELDSRERALRIQEQLFEQFKAQWTKPPPSPHRMTGASWNQV
jgi:myosin heavy subunit